MSNPLDGCRSKLDWSEKHLNALSAEIRTFLEGDAYTLPTQFDEADKSTTVIFKESEPLPESWGLALGDVIHNARSALDHLVYQLVLLAGGVHHDAHQFPILDKPQDWVRRVQKPPKGRRGLLDFIDPTHITSIKLLQPYEPATGLPRLGVLRDFSNIDKHRLIHAARTVFTDTPALSAHLAVPATISDVRPLEPGTPIEDGTEILRFRSHTDLVIPQHQTGGPASSLWLPESTGRETVWGNPQNSTMNVEVKLPVTSVFGAPGITYTRLAEFRSTITELRFIVESFAPAFSS